MKRNLQGKYVTISTVGEKAQAFVPPPAKTPGIRIWKLFTLTPSARD